MTESNAHGYRAAALAAAFVKHDAEGNLDGMQAIIDEVNRTGALSTFVRALSRFTVVVGRELLGDDLPARLQKLAIDFQGDAEQ